MVYKGLKLGGFIQLWPSGAGQGFMLVFKWSRLDCLRRTREKMDAVKVLVAVLMMVSCKTVSAGNGCYTYYDHAAKYSLDHDAATSYPWEEVKQMMSLPEYQQLSQVFAMGTAVPTSRPPDSHYYNPVSVVCPSERFMLKAFKVEGKQCYVIKPEVQQVRYARCSDQYNRECHYCGYNKGGVSKCEEDYEWQTVWAYCKPLVVKPKPNPTFPYPQPKLVVPKPQPRPHYPLPKPYYPKPARPTYYPRPQAKPTQYFPAKINAKTNRYNPYGQRGSYGRWKRSLRYGKVEQISLYLPYQCGCKNFKC